MTERTQKLVVSTLNKQRWQLKNKRLLVPAVLVALLVATNTRDLTIGVLADAFWQVAAYVAATLALFTFLTDRFDRNGRLQQVLSANSKLQVLFAASMGALPGCGGAIVVITQYVRGNLSFGGVVAVLTATMGDAAFLLLATQPVDGVLMIAIGFAVGLVCGVVVDRIHGGDFLRPEVEEFVSTDSVDALESENNSGTLSSSMSYQGRFWQWALLPAMVFAILGSFQIDTDAFFGLPEGMSEMSGAVLAVVALSLWAVTREVTDYQSAVSEDPKCKQTPLFVRVAQDTNFVSVWVIAAFLAFELTVSGLNLDLSAVFGDWLPLMPLMGVVVGLLPGCGPQILVTSMYLNGAVPMSAQVGNAISNDGDALFPAIAMAPKAALVATVYSTIPALIAAYSYFFLFE